jgi:hypothetical protein
VSTAGSADNTHHKEDIHLRRIVIIGTALAVLAAAASASAAINTYTATFAFSGGKGGTTNKPAPLSFKQHINAQGTNGNRTATLLDIKTKVYGMVADGKDFPTCTLGKIGAAKSDTGCPKGSLVATGAITSTLGSANNLTLAAGGASCNPFLHVYNGGQGKLVYFFVDGADPHQCLSGGLVTGDVGPYAATYKRQGKFLVTDLPIPKYVDFPSPGLVGSLITSDLNWLKVTAKVHGKTVAANASVGCQKGKRPYTTTFTAQLGAGGVKETTTVSHTASC